MLNNMKLILTFIISLGLWHEIISEDLDVKDEENEVVRVLQESIKTYGPPRPLNYKNCDLKGPEVLSGDHRLILDDIFNNDPSGNYTIKLRTVMKSFSYNNHYERGESELIGEEKYFTIKGQFTQRFPKSGGGYYLRTIGYISDINGFDQFLLDVSVVTTEAIKRDA